MFSHLWCLAAQSNDQVSAVEEHLKLDTISTSNKRIVILMMKNMVVMLMIMMLMKIATMMKTIVFDSLHVLHHIEY